MLTGERDGQFEVVGNPFNQFTDLGINGSGSAVFNTGALGPEWTQTMLVGAARTNLAGGYLFRFNFTKDRKHYVFTDSRLDDLVADNAFKFDITESESLKVGQGFGIVPDIRTSPTETVVLSSLDQGVIYDLKHN